jgi:hypothetical protein
MKVTLSLIVALLLSASPFGDDQPHFRSAHIPFYPPLCREARIEGKVSLHFIVNEQGDTAEVGITLREVQLHLIQHRDHRGLRFPPVA